MNLCSNVFGTLWNAVFNTNSIQHNFLGHSETQELTECDVKMKIKGWQVSFLLCKNYTIQYLAL